MERLRQQCSMGGSQRKGARGIVDLSEVCM